MADLSGADGGLRELALFAGAGGGILGGKLLGWRTVCAVEFAPYAASVLAARQNDGLLQAFPIWDDVRTFDGKPWRGIVDVVSGGFPCQDISAAGAGVGIDGERSGLWREMARIIGEVRPRFVFVENSPLLVGRGLARVLSDLASMGFDAKWGVLGAADVGAPHRRERCWIVAQSTCDRREQGRAEPKGRQGGFEACQCGASMADTVRSGLFSTAQAGIHCGQEGARARDEQLERCSCTAVCDAAGARPQNRTAREIREPGTHKEFERPDWWATEPDVGRVAHGVAARVDRLKAIGNGQVPQCAAQAWRILTHNDPAKRTGKAQL